MPVKLIARWTILDNVPLRCRAECGDVVFATQKLRHRGVAGR